MTKGFEFLLLLRKANIPQATVLRKWSVEPRDMAKDSPPRATLQYDATTNMATVSIAGLRTPVQDTVEIPR